MTQEPAYQTALANWKLSLMAHLDHAMMRYITLTPPSDSEEDRGENFDYWRQDFTYAIQFVFMPNYIVD